jgi:hypothetical protein
VHDRHHVLQLGMPIGRCTRPSRRRTEPDHPRLRVGSPCR